MFGLLHGPLEAALERFGYRLAVSDRYIEAQERKDLLKRCGVSTDVAIIGPYLIHNFGDDLIGAVIAANLKKAGMKASIPGLTLANSKWLDLVPHASVEEAVAHARAVMLGGGHLLGEGGPDKGNVLKYLEIAHQAVLQAEARGLKSAITAVGAGPLTDARAIHLTREILAKVSCVGVRDRESAEFLLHDIGVAGDRLTVGADVALTWPDSLSVSEQSNGLMGIQFDPQSLVPEETALDALGAIATFAEENIGDIAFVSNSGADTRASQHSALLAPNLNYTYLPDFLRHLAGFRTIFTSHLHLSIAAYAARIPCFSVYVRDKTKRFYEQIGRPDRALDLATAGPGEIRDHLERAKSAEWEDSDEVRLNELKALAYKLLDVDKLFNGR